MVTYSGLFQFCILIVAIINLIVTIFLTIKNNRPRPKVAVIFYDVNFRQTVSGIAFCIYIIEYQIKNVNFVCREIFSAFSFISCIYMIYSQ